MIEDDTQNSRHAASAAFHNAPRLTKIAQAGMQGGPTGAAAEAAVQYRKEVLIVVIAVLHTRILFRKGYPRRLPAKYPIRHCEAGLHWLQFPNHH